MFALAVLACSGDSTSGPVNQPGLVLAFTQVTSLACKIELSSLAGQHHSLGKLCGYEVAWSPDGSRLAYLKEGGEAQEPSLWMVNADGTHADSIPNGYAFASPDWSPDGQQLVAFSLLDGDLAVLNVDGSGAHVLTGSAGLTVNTRASWSPDGSSILFVRNDTLFQVDAVSGTAHMLDVPGLHGIVDPRWSPDGSRIAFIAPVAQLTAVYTMNADGSNLKPVVADEIDYASWSPDGRSLVYSSLTAGGRDIFIFPSDGNGKPINLTNNQNGDLSLDPDWARSR